MGRLLVVSRPKSGLRALQPSLVAAGHLCQAIDDESAVQVVRAHPPDLLLVEIEPPTERGLALLQAVRREHTPMLLPVIVVTAAGDSRAGVTAFAHGASDHVTHPVDEPALLARIATHLRLRELQNLRDEFLRMTGHDLKNPLSAIMGAAELLLASLRLNPSGRPEDEKLAAMMLRRAVGMQRLISDFLDLGALEEGRIRVERVPMDIALLAAQAIEESHGYARFKGIELELVTTGPLHVHADPGRLMQVLDNLIGNAIKYGHRGGRVEVRGRIVQRAVRIEVWDDGPGIDPADAPLLFVRHARLRNRPTGGESSTGIGLVIAKHLVELHGGRIGAEPARRRGSVFWFELPVD